MRLATSPWMLATLGAATPPLRRGTVVTPTRLPGLAAALRRWSDRWRDASRRIGHVDALDAAALRDLGLSHAAAALGRDPHAARRSGAAATPW